VTRERNGKRRNFDGTQFGQEGRRCVGRFRGPDGDERRAQRFLGYRLRRAEAAMHRDFIEALADLGLTQKQTATLWLINSNRVFRRYRWRLRSTWIVRR
jgi:hypothetical protein